MDGNTKFIKESMIKIVKQDITRTDNEIERLDQKQRLIKARICELKEHRDTAYDIVFNLLDRVWE